LNASVPSVLPSGTSHDEVKSVPLPGERSLHIRHTLVYAYGCFVSSRGQSRTPSSAAGEIDNPLLGKRASPVFQFSPTA
jgi:hypothetical protein